MDMRLPKRTLFTVALFSFFACYMATAQEDTDCFFCHGEKTCSKTNPDGSTTPLFVDQPAHEASVHAKTKCIGCHDDIKEVPHKPGLKPVTCAKCHADEQKLYDESLHGQAAAKGDVLAPKCVDCHGKHDTKSTNDPTSRTNPIHVPELCGTCHADDAPVAKTRNPAEQAITSNYAQSLHAEGLLKKGLTVTAMCTSCHTAHHVLPHTDPRSTIARENLVKTCTKCHGLIEEVHRKVIQGQLWEKEPDQVPICIDCHQPHKARRIFYDEGVSDKDCMACHDKAIQSTVGAPREIAVVDTAKMAGARHQTVRCAQCHTGASPDHTRPCDTVTKSVDCTICHAEQVEQHKAGIHGQLEAKGDPDAPKCLDCHTAHDTLGKTDPASPTFPRNVPQLCGKCHETGGKAEVRQHSSQQNVLTNYLNSVHGRALTQSSLVVTATCVSCHTAHKPLPASDPASSVNPLNTPAMCGKCHNGIEETFAKSIHATTAATKGKQLPVCNDCHSAHEIKRTEEDAFRKEILTTCGRCHEEVTKSYFETQHGKLAHSRDPIKVARCSDCHGAHDVLPPTDPNSHLSRDNIVATCQKCHPDANRRFAGYLTHATHHDPVKYPILFVTFWSMTLLLVGTFVFFGLHTLAWLPHSFRELRERKAQNRKQGEGPFFIRFDPITRQLHFFLILSFFGLALTGMALKFSYMPWAQWLAHQLGGFSAAGNLHRICAVIMLLDFVVHLGVVVSRKRASGQSWWKLLTGTASLVPNLTDLKEFFQTLRWFFKRGPQPHYGKWTYWEKFDYFAVFWGIAIIGSTGLMLWFPEFFTRFLPGSLINVATIIHSDEALLAVGFIFTIHFFNTHFRPEKFPMDMAMFTGRTPVEELKTERPRYYEELSATGELDKQLATQAPKEFRFWAAIFGTIALVVGFTLVLFILWSMIVGYR